MTHCPVAHSRRAADVPASTNPKPKGTMKRLNLKPWSWRVAANPNRTLWPGTWIAWHANQDSYGECHAPLLRSYVGDERARQVHAALRAGHRAGTFTCPEQPLCQLG